MSGILSYSLALREPTTKTISSGVITADRNYHVIAAETGTTDALDTITSAFDSLSVDGNIYYPPVMFIADTGDTITLKHGTGNLDLPDDADIILSDDTYIILIYNGTIWRSLGIPLVGTVAASEVSVLEVGTATYDDAQDSLTLGFSAGWISGGALTDNGDGTVDIAAGTGRIRESDSSTANLRFFDWSSSAGLTMVDGDSTYIYLDYNAGSPQLAVTTTGSTVRDNERSLFELYEVVREGTTLHITDHRQIAIDGLREVQRRLYEVERITRAAGEGGLILGETGTRNLTLTAGAVWVKLRKSSIAALDTSGADDFDRYYRDGGGGWTKQSAQTQWNNTQYDDGSGTLATISNNRYSAQYFYVDADGELVSLFGQAEYVSIAGAEGDSPPSSVPVRIEEHALLVGRIIFQESAVSATSVESAFTTTFSGSAVTDHGSLAGLGDDDHSQYTLLAGRSGGQTLYGGTDASDDITISSTSNATKGDTILADHTVNGELITTGGTGAIDELKYNLAASAAPTVNDDSSAGYAIGSLWIDTTNDNIYRATDVSVGAANWEQLNGAAGSGISYATLRDEKATTTAGGGASATTWNPRDLNTEVYDADNIVSISSNQFTPIAGTYILWASAPANEVNGHRLRLYNATGTASVEEGLNAATNANVVTPIAHLNCIFTANGTDAYQIDHYTGGAKASTGLGLNVSDGSNEVYLTIRLEKIA